MHGFSLARLQYLDISGIFAKGAIPGEWYWYSGGHYRVGIAIRLGAVLPAGILMIWQFVPAIRHSAILFRRINGYIIILLLIPIGNVGALIVARRAMGGELSTQTGIGTLVILSTVSLCLAYYNIKKLQIDQHRAWMLRTMFYMGTIITMRIIMVISAQIVMVMGSYYMVMTCGEARSVYGPGYIAATYPSCTENTTTISNVHVTVHAGFAGGRKAEIGVSLRIGFGMALWLSLFLHLVGVEIYLALTPREAQRLRMVAYERQMEAGLNNPGSAGLVFEKIGDAEEWTPT